MNLSFDEELLALTRSPDSALLTMPTGAGKTLLARLASEQALLGNGKVIVLAPTRALVEEIAAAWAAHFSTHQVQAYTSERAVRLPYRQADIIVMTPERLDLCTRNWKRHHHWLSRLHLIVADELHLIREPQRGPALEAALVRLTLINPLARLLALTATCGNPEQISQWLNARHVHREQRPVPLEWDYHLTTDKPATLQQLLTDQPTLVFVHSRKRAEQLAETLQSQGWKAAAHHAGLSRDERTHIEQLYRTQQVRVLLATPTLAVGVNLPAQHVILYDLTYYNQRIREPLSIIDAWQRAGRAGRPGQHTTGRVSVIGTKYEDPQEYLVPRFEPLQSAMTGIYLESFILGSIDGRFATNLPQLERLLARTLLARTTRINFTLALYDLERYGAVNSHDGHFSVTPLGQIASRTMLSAGDVAFQRYLPPDPTAFDIISAAAQRRLALHTTPESHMLSQAILKSVPSHRLDSGELTRDKTLNSATIAYAACHADEHETALSFGIAPHDLRLYREELTRLINAWADLTQSPKLRLVAAMLRSALPLGPATLTLLHGVGPKTAHTWYQRGITDVEDFATLLPNDPRLDGMQPSRRHTLITQAEQLIKTFDHDITQEPPAQHREEYAWDFRGEIDPVRLARATLLNVESTDSGYLVTGGNAPHQVNPQLQCDCPDFRSQRPCKHVLAIKLHLADPATVRNAELLT